MSETKVLPKAINLNKQDKTQQFLEIIWSDEQVCRYPLSHLREACPCVECRGGHQFMGMKYAPENLLSLKPARSYEIESLQAVGNYALQPVWDDGHSTGLYTWEYLRHLFPANSEKG